MAVPCWPGQGTTKVSLISSTRVPTRPRSATETSSLAWFLQAPKDGAR